MLVQSGRFLYIYYCHKYDSVRFYVLTYLLVIVNMIVYASMCWRTCLLILYSFFFFFFLRASRQGCSSVCIVASILFIVLVLCLCYVGESIVVYYRNTIVYHCVDAIYMLWASPVVSGVVVLLLLLYYYIYIIITTTIVIILHYHTYIIIIPFISPFFFFPHLLHNTITLVVFTRGSVASWIRFSLNVHFEIVDLDMIISEIIVVAPVIFQPNTWTIKSALFCTHSFHAILVW